MPREMGDTASTEHDDERTTVTVDQEAWLQDRIYTAINMAIAIDAERGVGADERQAEDAIEGIVNGTAVEIVNTLNLTTEGENLRLRGDRDSHLDASDGE